MPVHLQTLKVQIVGRNGIEMNNVSDSDSLAHEIINLNLGDYVIVLVAGKSIALKYICSNVFGYIILNLFLKKHWRTLG